MKPYKGVLKKRLNDILNRFDNVRAGVLGDICLDVYWHADMRNSELSLETPHFNLPITDEKMSLGGGANVAANMVALKPKSVEIFGAVGNDWRGRELINLLKEQNIGVSGVVTRPGFSSTYIKPIRRGISNVAYEDPRLDFLPYEHISRELEDDLIAALSKSANSLDVLCISDQLLFGVVTSRLRKYVSKLAGQGLCVIVDSRHNIGLFKNAVLKPNEFEGAAAAGMDAKKIETLKDCEIIAQTIVKQTGCSVFMTIGDKGSICIYDQQVWHIPAQKVDDPIDIVGAGDSSLSGFGLALAAGAEPCEAAIIAGLCSAVTIKQIGTTGTATREQVLLCASKKAT